MSLKIMDKVWDMKCGGHTNKIVFLALADNANDERQCWPSIATIARKCDLTQDGVRKVIRRLVDSGLVAVNPPGKHTANTYELFPGQLTPPIRGIAPPIQGIVTPYTPYSQTVSEPSSNHNNHASREVFHLRPLKGSEDDIQSQSLAIYEAYPKHIAKPPALKAISKALKSKSFDELMKLTRKFAALWPKGSDKTYCPHPSTWFNQERYNDDPAEWAHGGKGKNVYEEDKPYKAGVYH
jgi:hypothetical protein